MIRQIKDGIDESVSASSDAQVRHTVEQILSDISTQGAAAVKALSEKFDRWTPAHFRLSDAEI